MIFQKILSNLTLLLASTATFAEQGCITTTTRTSAGSHSTIMRTAPDSRYELLDDNAEVKDKKTGLIWQRCSLGQTWSGEACIGKAAIYNWEKALQTAKDMGDVWRVPNTEELESLIEEACSSPSINITFFPNTQCDRYWSSSLYGSSTSLTFVVGFGSGRVNAVYNNVGFQHCVRLVRSGQEVQTQKRQEEEDNRRNAEFKNQKEAKTKQDILDLDKAALQREEKQDALARQRVQSEARKKRQNYPYPAIISCGYGGNNFPLMACFGKSKLKLSYNNRSMSYGVYEFATGNRPGDINSNYDLNINLPKHFHLVAENSHVSLMLSVKVIDSKGAVVFEDQAGQWGSVNVEN